MDEYSTSCIPVFSLLIKLHLQAQMNKFVCMSAVVLGDFTDDLLSAARSPRLLRVMPYTGFSQCVKVVTTDSGSLQDHTYYSATAAGTNVDVVDIHPLL